MNENKLAKNPLNLMLGAFLRIIRNGKGYSSKEMSDKLNLGTSYYRMIEAGSFQLNPNRIFLLKEILQDDVIDPERAIKYLVGVQYVQSCMDLGKTPYDALKELADIDEDFNKFFIIVNPFFDYTEDSEVQKKFLETSVIKEVSAFLNQKRYSTPQTNLFQNKLFDKIQETPSLTLELVLDFITTLSQHPPMHVGDFASKWETDNMNRFLSLRGLYQSSDIIINEENLENFNYSYLFKKNFKSLNFIFLEDSDPNKLKKKFVSMLNSVYIKKKRDIFGKEEIKKINFKCAGDSSPWGTETRILLSGKEKSLSYSQAFWSFSTEQANQIGFIGAPRGNRYQVLNLTYKESIERNSVFDRIWDNVK